PLLITASDTPKADVILNFSVDPRSKSDRYVAWLYREGVAPKVVTVSSQISHGAYPADFVRDHLVTLGVRSEDSLALHVPILACRALIMAEMAKYLKAQGARSALVICQPEDSRHLSWVASRIFGREGLEVAVAYAPEDLEEVTADWYYTHWKVQRFVYEAVNVSLDQFYSECR
ncbi:MAG: hypothetical protein ACREEM_54295, partial [Blastocatellia bacterium]